MKKNPPHVKYTNIMKIKGNLPFKALLIILFVLNGCSHPRTTKKSYGKMIISSDDKNLISIVEKDLDELASYKTLINLKDIKEISISKNNCYEGAIACVFKTYPSKIFLTPKYFEVSRLERQGTLIHEYNHHLLGYKHIPCKSKQIRNTECDESLQSAFGKELKFYRLQKDSVQKKELIQRTQVRINSLN